MRCFDWLGGLLLLAVGLVNRAQLMLEVLRDGRPHARRDLFERCGFFLTNNAASELRAMGYDIRQTRERVDGVNVYSYQLHGSLSEGDGIRPTSAVGREPAGETLAYTSSSESDSLKESDCEENASGVAVLPAAAHGSADASDSLSEPETLFTYPRTPAWG